MSGMTSEEELLNSFKEFFDTTHSTYIVRVSGRANEKVYATVCTVEGSTRIEAYIRALETHTPQQIVEVEVKKHD
jgi:hypothetical protein